MNTTAKTIDVAASVAGPGLIVFGRDGASKAHASWFDEANAGPARAAAAEMGFFALQVTGDGLSAISASLPAGRLFASGRAFVPFVKGAVFDRLVEHLPEGTVIPAPRLRVVASGPENLTGGSSKPGSAGGAADLPQDWAHIKVGSLVLATEDRTEGYFECIVVEAKPSDMFTLKWRDFPDLETIVRHRSNVALLFPSKISR